MAEHTLSLQTEFHAQRGGIVLEFVLILPLVLGMLVVAARSGDVVLGHRAAQEASMRGAWTLQVTHGAPSSTSLLSGTAPRTCGALDVGPAGSWPQGEPVPLARTVSGRFGLEVPPLTGVIGVLATGQCRRLWSPSRFTSYTYRSPSRVQKLESHNYTDFVDSIVNRP